jgi:cytochrome c oxidase subunit 3
MAHGEVKHDYHLVNPSPWPFVASIGALMAALGFVAAKKGLVADDANFILGQGHWTLFLLGMVVLIFTCIGWWSDVIKESKAGDHTPVVDIGLRYGMILFIASEVMFFVAWFWVFFELAIFHERRGQPA